MEERLSDPIFYNPVAEHSLVSSWSCKVCEKGEDNSILSNTYTSKPTYTEQQKIFANQPQTILKYLTGKHSQHHINIDTSEGRGKG